MSDDRIRESWRARRYEGSRSYTRMNYPRALADAGQAWFRDSAIAVVRQRTRRAHPFRRVVDLGCGVGDWTLRYLEFAEHVTGADISEAFIAEARASATRLGVDDRSDFAACDIAGWTDFADAGLVTVGAVMMYLTEDEIVRLLARVSEQQRRGDWLYVRATVANLGRAHSTDGGHYRARRHYEQLFQAAGYATEVSTYSSSLTTTGTLVRGGISHPLARLLTAGLDAAVVGARLLTRDVDYCNWILRRR